MKKIIFTACIAAAIVLISFATKNLHAQTAGTVTFTVKTLTSNGDYSPSNIVAIWVTNASGAWVKTRKLRANERREWLLKFVAASPTYNVVDAITGATLNNHNAVHTVTWNCLDVNGNLVPDGNYTLWIEFTEGHIQGPFASFTFVKGPTAQTLTPANMTNFQNININWAPVVGIADANAKNPFSVEPNPLTSSTNISYSVEKKQVVDLKVFNQAGELVKVIFKGEQTAGNYTQKWDATNSKGSKVANGIYYISLTNGTQTSSQKVVISE